MTDAPTLSAEQLRATLSDALDDCSVRPCRVLVLHPDYSRNDFTHLLVPALHDLLAERGLERLDTLNAAGTHRRMEQWELLGKLGLDPRTHSRAGTLFNHDYDDPEQLLVAGRIPADLVADRTAGHLRQDLDVTVNRLLVADYDLIVCISGTVPHEALGYSGGTKILFPGVSGPEVIGLLHWAAVLMGIPQIIGRLDNPARQVVDAGAALIFDRIGGRPVLSLNMVCTEDDSHRAVPRGLFAGVGPAGFSAALARAAEQSARLHVRYLDAPVSVAVQQIPKLYDEVWTAGKGSYKLQKPGVMKSGGEIILYAPHIESFHSKPAIDRAIRAIGYHGRDYVVEFCRRHPDFDRNVAAHVINVRGLGERVGVEERFEFRVTLASQISESDCRAVGLGYRDPDSLRRSDFDGPGRLWIEEGGVYLLARR
jgi:nickel-dependent lactate racemase